MHVFIGTSDVGFTPGQWNVRGPVRAGDLDGFSEGDSVLIVDGYFGTQRALTIAEIRAAISRGVDLWGAVSMGALRAAECAPLGMKPIGTIAQLVVDGQICSDSDLSVGVSADGGCTVPFINVRYLSRQLLDAGYAIEPVREFLGEMRAKHFSVRTPKVLRDAAIRILGAEVEDYVTRRSEQADILAWDLKAMDLLCVFDQLDGGLANAIEVSGPIPRSINSLLSSTPQVLV